VLLGAIFACVLSVPAYAYADQSWNLAPEFAAAASGAAQPINSVSYFK